MDNVYVDYTPMYPVMVGCGHPPSGQYHHECLVKTLQDCQATCGHMTNLLVERNDMQKKVRLLQMLRDCEDACGLTAEYTARDSVFARQSAGLCACVCEACGSECVRVSDQESQNCARVCMHCARECRTFESRA